MYWRIIRMTHGIVEYAIMMIKKYLAVTQLLLVLLLFGAGGAYHSTAFAQDDVFDTLKMNRLSEPVEVPDFTLPSLDGKEMKISDYKGNIIFLNFWTTW